MAQLYPSANGWLEKMTILSYLYGVHMIAERSSAGVAH